MPWRRCDTGRDVAFVGAGALEHVDLAVSVLARRRDAGVADQQG
jgi:hypothetical protein